MIINGFKRILKYCILLIKKRKAAKYVDSCDTKLPIIFDGISVKLKIIKRTGARLNINGKLTINSYLGGTEPVTIILGENSVLTIDGNFNVGNGTQIVVNKNANLYIGGAKDYNISGITEKSRIMINKKAYIGSDCIIGWNVFITDCDWHSIEGKNPQSDVYIGNHVWLASNSSVLKGSFIDNDSILASASLTINKKYEKNCLLVGVPAQKVKQNIKWNSEMIKTL